MNRNILPIFSLILVNLIPLYMVVFEEWTIITLMITYWTESVIVGLYSLLRIIKSEKKDDLTSLGFKFDQRFAAYINAESLDIMTKTAIIMAFVLYYSIFLSVYGMFVFVTIYIENFQIDTFGVMLGTISLFISHGISYKKNYISKGEYKHTSPLKLLTRPFMRSIALHVAVAFAVLLTIDSKNPEILITYVIALKILLDIIFHTFEHKYLVKDIDKTTQKATI